MTVDTLVRLPQAGKTVSWLTDGGHETTLIFHEGLDLPLFASFPLMETPQGRDALERYARRYMDLAVAEGASFVLETPTWRASHGWGAQLGYGKEAITRINRNAVRMARRLADGYPGLDVVVSGNIGPAGDGYSADTMMSPEVARDYHAHQINALAEAGADMVNAITMTHVGEAAGVVMAAMAAGIPVAISFTVETDGRLPSGESIAFAIHQIDRMTDGYAVYFGINCAHPEHFAHVLETGEDWVLRIGQLRANASRMSHEELDNAEELDEGDPEELGRAYARLRELLPNLAVIGGCCGTDHRHVGEMARHCMH